MRDLSVLYAEQIFPIRHPDRIQLLSNPTPNGVKVSIALEELGLPYEAHFIPFGEAGVKSPEFLDLNLNGKVPVFIDPEGPSGNPLTLAESGAILEYLGAKTGRLMPADPAIRWKMVQWLYFQASGVAPMVGQMGYFLKSDGKEIADKRPLERYVAETRRLLAVLDDRLIDRTWIMTDDYTLADIALIGWVRDITHFLDCGELVGFDSYRNLNAWFERCLARPAVQRGLQIPKRPD